MRDIIIEGPDGNSYAFPEGTSQQVMLKAMRQRFPPPSMSLMDVGAQAIQNIPGSAVQFGKGIAEAVTSPVKTAGSLLDIAAGGVNLALPEPVRNFLAKIDTDPAATQRAVNAAQQFGGVYKQRYGSVDALKRTIAEDPVGAVADLSTVFSGGAGAARGAAAATARAAPSVSAGATQAANMMTRAAAATNPINVLAKPARGAAKIIERAPVAVQRFVSPKGAAYMEATEGRAGDIVQQLRSPNLEMVPGSTPTAAQAASPLGVTKFSALGASAEKVLPTEYYARGTEQKAARVNAIRGVGKTPADLSAAVKARSDEAKVLYGAAEKPIITADTVFTDLLARPSMDKVISRARELAAEEGFSFQTGQNRPAQTVTSKVLNAQGQPTTSVIPAEFAQYPGRSLHFMKMAFGDLTKNPERFGIGATEAGAIKKTGEKFLNWAETQNPPYKTARQAFAAKSKPINQMEVGQYLEGKLTAPLGAGEQRAGVFANAVRDAAGTIKRATTNEARFKALTDVLTPDQVRVVESIRDDLARAAETKAQAQKGTPVAPKVDQLASAGGRSARLPNLMSRVASVANDIMSRVAGKIDSKLAIQLATEMLDPQAAAAAIEKAMASEGRARAVGKNAAAAARAAGRAAGSPAALAGGRVQNAMANQNNQ
jgi:hypothetical protein